MGERVLIVEDDDVLREVYSVKFSLEGFDVVSAADGQEGLEQVKAHKPRLIVLDMLMPRLSGLDFLRLFQAMPGSGQTKVLIASNKTEDKAIAQAMALGACDYLVKSAHTPEEIVARARQHLSAA